MTTTWIGALLLTVAVAVTPSMAVAGADAVAQVRAEIERIRQSLKDKPLTGAEFADANTTTVELLKGASEALDGGRIYLGLEKLAQVSDFLEGARMRVDRGDGAKGELPAFEAEWTETSRTLQAMDGQLRAIDWSAAQAAIRALSEAAWVRTTPLLDGGRGFAIATGPKDGLFYLGQAKGSPEFARFCASLRLPRRGRAVAVRSLLPELEELQTRTNAAFQPPRSIDLHPRFIALNSTLKLARELDAAKFRAGALYQYLEAVRHYRMLDTAAPADAAAQSALKESISTWQKKLEAAKEDDSIARIFVERAASYTGGANPAKDEWRSAQVIVDHVLPAFFAARLPAAHVSAGRQDDRDDAGALALHLKHL